MVGRRALDNQQASSAPAPAGRIASLDTLRVAAMGMVVCIHTAPFYNVPDERLYIAGRWFIHLCRIAIPFFFLTSGYLFGRSVKQGRRSPAALRARLRRLGIAFGFWAGVYILHPGLRAAFAQAEVAPFFRSLNGFLNWAAANPVTLLLEGPRVHLWFLVSLLISLSLLGGLVYAGCSRRTLLVLAGALYVVFLFVGGPYEVTPLGVKTGFNPRNGPCFSALFVFTGYALASARLPDKRSIAILFAAGFGIHLLEGILLRRVWHTDFAAYDFFVGTVPWSVGAFMAALRLPNLGSGTVWPRIGRYMLGVYGAHMLFVEYLYGGYDWIGLYAFQVLYPVMVFLFSLALAYALALNRWTRPTAC